LFVNQREHRCETPITGQAQPARSYRTLLLQMGTKNMDEHQVDKLSRRGTSSWQTIDVLPHQLIENPAQWLGLRRAAVDVDRWRQCVEQ
jgi:hypothetical protein